MSPSFALLRSVESQWGKAQGTSAEASRPHPEPPRPALSQQKERVLNLAEDRAVLLGAGGGS